MGNHDGKLTAELTTIGNALSGIRDDLDAMLSAHAPSKRNGRYSHYLAQLQSRIAGAELCVKDARAILAATEPEQGRG